MQKSDRQLQIVQTPTEKAKHLEKELETARMQLVQAEADLAEEQAAVNAFRLALPFDNWTVGRFLTGFTF